MAPTRFAFARGCGKVRVAVFFNSAKKALKPIAIFTGLDEAALGELAKRCKKIEPEIGEVIFEENSIGNEMFLISEGRVRIVGKRGTPGETTLTELGPGEFFGEMCLIEQMPRSASAVAIEESVLFSLADSDVQWLMKSRPDQFSILLLNISRHLCRRLRVMNELFAALLPLTRKQKEPVPPLSVTP